MAHSTTKIVSLAVVTVKGAFLAPLAQFGSGAGAPVGCGAEPPREAKN